jgi:hypothetical protein
MKSINSKQKKIRNRVKRVSLMNNKSKSKKKTINWEWMTRNHNL